MSGLISLGVSQDMLHAAGGLRQGHSKTQGISRLLRSTEPSPLTTPPPAASHPLFILRVTLLPMSTTASVQNEGLTCLRSWRTHTHPPTPGADCSCGERPRPEATPYRQASTRGAGEGATAQDRVSLGGEAPSCKLSWLVEGGFPEGVLGGL